MFVVPEEINGKLKKFHHGLKQLKKKNEQFQKEIESMEYKTKKTRASNLVIQNCSSKHAATEAKHKTEPPVETEEVTKKKILFSKI